MAPMVMGIGMQGYVWVSYKLKLYTDKEGVCTSSQHMQGYMSGEGLIPFVAHTSFPCIHSTSYEYPIRRVPYNMIWLCMPDYSFLWFAYSNLKHTHNGWLLKHGPGRAAFFTVDELPSNLAAPLYD